MGVDNANSRQVDMYQQQLALNAKTGTIIQKMKDLSLEAQNGNITSTRLQQIQIALQDLQRDLDTMKQIEEAIKKAMESVNKFPQ